MPTPDLYASNSTPILLLGGCTLVCAIILLILVGVGLRALVEGRDDVCVFSWRFPLEVMEGTSAGLRSLLRLRELPTWLSSFRPSDTYRPIPDSGILREASIMYLRVSFLLLRRKLKHPRQRRAVPHGRYQTYGARMRARASQQAA